MVRETPTRRRRGTNIETPVERLQRTAARAHAEGDRRSLRDPRRTRRSSCRSRWASRASSTSRCWTASRPEIRSSRDRSRRFGNSADGQAVQIQQNTRRRPVRHGPGRSMNQVLDSIVIALQAIWANKLRSFMTVLGNIVAVTSIVTVVTLIQGMNGMVADAIVSDIGADSFTIQRRPPIFNEDDEERARNNPLITIDEAEAIRAFSPIIASVAAQANQQCERVVSNRGSRQRPDSGSHELLQRLLDLQRRDGTHDEPVEVERGQPVALLGWGLADRLFGDINPLDKTIKIAGHQFPRRRRQRTEGIVLREFAGQLRGDPARRLSAPLRRPAVAAAHGQADHPPMSCRPPWTMRRWRCVSAAG